MSHPLVTDQTEFDGLVDRWALCDRIALDTEFHREKTYFPRLALLQVADPGGVSLVDPTRVNVSSLDRVFTSGTTIVMHAAQQDLEVLHRVCRSLPGSVIDTQLIAGFVGYSTPSLANLIQAKLGHSIPKGDRLTDWFARPLSDDQRRYAASDVEHLLELLTDLETELVSLGRLEWATQACNELLTRRYEPTDPAEAWLKLKDIRTLSGGARACAQAIASWRESCAQRDDIPARFVLSDMGVLTVAQRRPTDVAELSAVRGVDSRAMKGRYGEQLLRVIREAPKDPIPYPVTEVDDGDKKMRPAVTLATAWISELARREKLDPALLATKTDVVTFLRGSTDSRLSSGWRNDLVGQDLTDLLAGKAALSFDGKGHLRLIRANAP